MTKHTLLLALMFPLLCSAGVTNPQATSNTTLSQVLDMAASARTANALTVNLPGGMLTVGGGVYAKTALNSGDIIIALGESIWAGFPINTTGGSGQATAHSGTVTGKCVAQWLSVYNPGIPVYSYALSSATTNATSVQLAATNGATEYLNGAVVNGYSGTSSTPAQLVAALSAGSTAYFINSYDGINDANASISVSTYSSNLTSLWATERSYGNGSNVKIGNMTTQASVFSPFSVTYLYGSFVRSQYGVTTGCDFVPDVTSSFIDNKDANFYHTDNAHLLDPGCRVYAAVVEDYLLGRKTAPSESGALVGLNLPNTFLQTNTFTLGLVSNGTETFNGSIVMGTNKNIDFPTSTASSILLFDANNSGWRQAGMTTGSGFNLQIFTTNFSGAHVSISKNSSGSLNVIGTITDLVQFDNVDGSLNFLTAGGGIVGGVTSTLPAAGRAGFTAASTVTSASPVSLTTATTANVCSQAVAAGHYLVSFQANVTSTTATMVLSSPMLAGISTTSATLPTTDSQGSLPLALTLASATNSIPVASQEVTLTSSSTIYGVENVTFSAGTESGFGKLTIIQLP